MKQVYKAKSAIIFTSLVIVAASLYGCGGEKIAEIYPPIVYKPVPGELGGGPISDNLTVKVVKTYSGEPIVGASVFVHQGDPMELKASVDTGADGVATFAGKGITGPVSVTVTSNKTVAYDTVSFINVNAANLVIPMEPRKDPGTVKTALTFIGLDSGDVSLSLNRNNVPYKEKVIKAGELETDPLTISVEKKPLTFSAMALDAGGNTSKFGFTVEPDGPLTVEKPAMINMTRISQENVRMCSGRIENPPANLDEPTQGWDPYKRYIFQIYGNAGLAGNVVTGFANLSKDYSYQAFIVNPDGLKNMRMEVSAMNRSDAWAEMSTVYKHFKFDSAPAKQDIKFMNVPKNLQISKLEGQPLPNLIWEAPEGNLTEVDIYHSDYNYHWTLYVAGEGINKLVVPPLDLGSPGAMVTDEIYRFRVSKWLVPGLDFNNTSFQKIQDTATNKAKSTLVKFMVKPLEE